MARCVSLWKLSTVKFLWPLGVIGVNADLSVLAYPEGKSSYPDWKAPETYKYKE
jgi:hypothetical protein